MKEFDLRTKLNITPQDRLTPDILQEKSWEMLHSMFLFLRDPQQITHEGLNQLATLSQRLLLDERIPAYFITAPHLRFSISASVNPKTEGFVGIPFDFSRLADKNPSAQLTSLVEVTSFVADFWRIRKTNRHASIAQDDLNGVRALCYASELLQVLETRAAEEEATLRLTEEQYIIRTLAPGGIADIPENLRVPIPHYGPAWG